MPASVEYCKNSFCVRDYDYGPDDFVEEDVDCGPSSSDIASYALYFKSLKPGMVIPPSLFQEWLHPDFKTNYTTVAPGYSLGWLLIK
jgi:hypothetical protein